MGATGSNTVKAEVNNNLLVFTTWDEVKMREFFHRGCSELSETFALRQNEFEFLLGRKLVNFPTSRYLFQEMLDTDKNKMVDKFEVMSLVCLCSCMSNKEKVEFLFEMFNFNNKGFLLEPELTLLMLSVTKVVFKADKKLVPPPLPVMHHFISIAFTRFAKLDPHSLRKPEIVHFVSETYELLTYLDAWRGSASQILLPKMCLWRDPFFLCNAEAITPTREWMKEGLPPAHFLRWRRRSTVASTSGTMEGCKDLFTHQVRTLKTIDKRKEYTGKGAVGAGQLVQGMLADRWLLNAVACCIGCPKIIEALFSLTEQEEMGRFCVKVFEGGGWRGVFVDDRIPCSPDCVPLFATSSDSREFWPLLLEKGIAKYLGSYGHIAFCARRFDAPFFALRLLTGGHVMKLSTYAFTWKSVEGELQEGEKNGVRFVQDVLDEGSLISFGRSEGWTMHASTLLKPHPRICPPHGYLFPVVGIYVKPEDGFVYLQVRDAFGYLVAPSSKPETVKADFATGHCNLYELRVDDVQAHFDTIALSRFPDALRVGAERAGFKTWQTEVRSNKTSGKENPARFLLKVQGHKQPPEEVKTGVSRADLSLRRLKTKASLESQGDYDVVSQGMKTRFDFERPRNFPGSEAKGAEPEKNEETKAEERRKRLEEEALRPVDVAITVSSSCDWVVAGSAEAGAKMRLRIVPSIKTILTLRARKKAVEDKLALERAFKQAQLEKQKQLLDDTPTIDAAATGAGAIATDTDAADIGMGFNSGEAAFASVDDQDDFGSVVGGGAGGSISSTETMKKRRHASTNAAHVGSDGRTIEEKERYLELEMFETRDSGPFSWMSKTLLLYPGEYYILVDVSFSMDKQKLDSFIQPLDTKETPWLEGRPVETDRVWLQVSSTGDYEVDAVSREQCPVHGVSVSSVPMRPDKWPFSAEINSELSTKGLINMLTRLRKDIVLEGAEFVALARKVKTVYKRQLKQIEIDAQKEKERIEAAERAAAAEEAAKQVLLEEAAARAAKDAAYFENLAKAKAEREAAIKLKEVKVASIADE